MIREVSFGRVGFLLALLSATSSQAAIVRKSADDTFPDKRVVAFVKAAEAGDSLPTGVDVNYSGEKGVTPLIWVMASGNRDAVKKLLELGADPNKKIDNLNSATWLAAGRDDVEMLELMLLHKGNPNILGSDGASALVIAVRQRLPKNIDLLVKFGADLNCSTPGRDTAATWAASLAQFDLLDHLLELGYSNDLRHLAAMVQANHLPKDSPQQRWKDKVIQTLRQRGVEYPVRPSKTDAQQSAPRATPSRFALGAA